jgi:predicted DCC family thiol-disulfide oxidoreductase YuxK
MTSTGPILLFDGVCNLCNSLVRFIARRDNGYRIRFVLLNSEAGELLMRGINTDHHTVDSVVYIKNGKYFLKSSAVLHLLKDIGNGWRLLYVFILIPKFIRDFFYDLVARTRYRIFGKTDSCIIHQDKVMKRFFTGHTDS